MISTDGRAEIERQLFEYAIASDTKDWERLGRLFSHGRYHFASAPGPEAAAEWGRTVVREDSRTQHVLSTLAIEQPDPARDDLLRSRNYLTLFAQDEQGLAHTVSACWFDSTWEVVDGVWRWRTHVITPLFRGDWRLIHKVQQFPTAAQDAPQD
ncbi:nuclear transport factor 2 family protein [Herbiconiux sp. VKM Ac-1786]|uniref:nuclear transport factor 2 family protein n=1 Tax=Herbiconiux sp. VKM Ac-1786 TaxID=2783824 RepID=UPI00188B29B8|nr:nuclear transport factor 2 family protein [Herbiconiux sp. VKM Ac-1786]MBF4571864.1 nuclear transport factor 2 family protein [Herbiconiux sp. VKM Ac-1786]